MAARIAGALLLTAVAVETIADAPQHVEVRIVARKVVQPADALLVLTHGDTVQIHCTSDEAVALHVHGYDLLVNLQAATTASTPFTARATGRFPVTSHGFAGQKSDAGHGRALLYIEVQPR